MLGTATFYVFSTGDCYFIPDYQQEAACGWGGGCPELSPPRAAREALSSLIFISRESSEAV